MAARWLVPSIIFAFLMLMPRPGAADVDRSVRGALKRGVVVHFLVRRAAGPVGARYENRAESLEGLWQQPEGDELQQLYVDRSGQARPSQAVPLLRMEW